MDEQKKSVLIVDDDGDWRNIVATKLRMAGFEIFEAKDGEEGLTQAKELLPDLLLLDINMPKMNGVEMLVKLKNEAGLSSVKVIFLTNFGEPQAEAAWLDKKFAKEIGAVGYIKKTANLDEMVRQVRGALSVAGTLPE